ncbi:MAG: ATP-binding protein [Candidatus Thiothrix putei]|uniref:histidine kinase n=2 Tax=Thiothrix TaxID=1030 RepID=A0A1H4GWE9_9GAMM|nr:ATP-binding protein [Thiothrix caldifontis]WGZ92530.1 MAG: ATP-binding protein [Candidatus Thiothrix putei]SEB13611.1 Signal transduction histidine kinase [Thiothrix caldifontis]
MTRKLLNTSVFRLSLVYALLFSTVAAGALGFIYWMAKGQMEQQTDARLQLETDALLNLYRSLAVEGLTGAISMRNSENGSRFLISRLIHRSQQDLTRDLQFDSFTQNPKQIVASLPLSIITGKKDHTEPARMMLTILPGGYQLLVVTDLKEQHTLQDRLFQTVLGAIGIIVALALAGGIFMGHNVQRRINAVGRTANDIMSGDLARRMPVTGRNDEFDSLSRVLNTMLARIEHLMQSMRDVTDNLAHDLRNPLNRLRNRLETSQYHPTAHTDYPQLIQDTIVEVDELIKTFNALLSIAQIESSRQRQDWADIDLTLLIEELADLYTAVAEEQNLTLTYQAEAGLHLHGNRQLIAQAITNLLDNAVKYTPPSGAIRLEATQQPKQICISVADNGPGIPETQREQVFKRFTRLDNARSTPGNGLGLSLVKAVAELHGASVQLQDNHPGLKASILISR